MTHFCPTRRSSDLAAIRDGATLDIGGVAAIRDVRHPVSVARSLLREIPVLLAGEGASRFAGQLGAVRALPHPFADKDTNEDDPACDTVGGIAVDSAGHIAAAPSSGAVHRNRIVQGETVSVLVDYS